jgi:hypothetical protein
VIVYFGHFFENDKIWAHFGATFFHFSIHSSCINFDKNGYGNISGDFFFKSSPGHPDLVQSQISWRVSSGANCRRFEVKRDRLRDLAVKRNRVPKQQRKQDWGEKKYQSVHLK